MRQETEEDKELRQMEALSLFQATIYMGFVRGLPITRQHEDSIARHVAAWIDTIAEPPK